MRGSCCCANVRFTVTGSPKGPSVCHCGQCRKMSGFAWSSAYVPEDQITIEGPVHWFASSRQAKRGICQTCGSFLFWKAHNEDTMSFALGAIDGPTGLTLQKHIFTADKGDYYALTDGLPQKE